MKHFIRKLASTVRILTCLGMARTFGQYQHSGWDGDINYARYSWRGREWIIPTGPAETRTEILDRMGPPSACLRKGGLL